MLLLDLPLDLAIDGLDVIVLTELFDVLVEHPVLHLVLREPFLAVGLDVEVVLEREALRLERAVLELLLDLVGENVKDGALPTWEEAPAISISSRCHSVISTSLALT